MPSEHVSAANTKIAPKEPTTKIEAANGSELFIVSGQAVKSPAHPLDYPVNTDYYPSGKVKPEHYLNSGQNAVEGALDYAHSLFPGSNLRVLSTESSSGVVLEDDQGNAFKVYADAHRYSYAENEMAGLTRLSALGIAPKPYVLVDAAPEYRTDSQVDDQHFNDEIVRAESKEAFPVIVMEKLDAVPLHTLSPSEAVQAFDRLWGALEHEGLVFGDVELVFDKASGQAKFVDLGGLYKGAPGRETMESLLQAFGGEFAPRRLGGNGFDPDGVRMAIEGGSDGIHSYLEKLGANKAAFSARLGSWASRPVVKQSI